MDLGSALSFNIKIFVQSAQKFLINIYKKILVCYNLYGKKYSNKLTHGAR